MTMSKNGMSWDTIKHVTSLAAWRYDANHATDAASKWFVGSSKITTWGFWYVKHAKLTRLF